MKRIEHDQDCEHCSRNFDEWMLRRERIRLTLLLLAALCALLAVYLAL